MLQIELSITDLGGVRFTTDPLAEVRSSLSALFHDHARAVHSRLQAVVAHADIPAELDLFTGLFHDPTWGPDLLSPEPLPDADTEALLGRVRALDLAVVERDLETLRRTNPTCTAAGLSSADLRSRVADAVGVYWRRVLHPFADRLDSIARADIAYRARSLAQDGVAAALSDVHGCVEFDGTSIIFPKLGDGHVTASGGVWLVPTVFQWPWITVQFETKRPVIWYPAIGAGRVWEAASQPEPQLARLLGANRARVLRHLQLPSTTTELARDLGLAKATVSEHLGALSDAGLLESRRDGRSVTYDLTPLGTQLLDN